MPFNWDYVDDNTLIYVDTSADGIKAMVDTALGEALEDVKADVVDETISTMDIKLEGENLLYRLLVKGDDKGEINIPKDQLRTFITSFFILGFNVCKSGLFNVTRFVKLHIRNDIHCFGHI